MGRPANKPTPADGEHYNTVLMTTAQHQPRAQANRTSALPWIVVARDWAGCVSDFLTIRGRRLRFFHHAGCLPPNRI